jgi:hypothetical protein
VDGRILLAASSFIGATLGVAVMSVGAPDTGGIATAAPAAVAPPAAALSAPVRPPPTEAARPSTARPVPSQPSGDKPDPFAAPPANPFEGAANDPFSDPPEDPFAALAERAQEMDGDDGPVNNPFAAMGEGNPFEPAADNPFADPGAWTAEGGDWAEGWGDPLSDRVDANIPPPDRPKAAGGSPFGAAQDLPGDVRGVGRLFRERDVKVKECMSRDAPAPMENERRVMIRVFLAPRPENQMKAGIQRIEAPKDEEGRYAAFLTCLQGVVGDAVFELPSSGSASVNWSLRR